MPGLLALGSPTIAGRPHGRALLAVGAGVATGRPALGEIRGLPAPHGGRIEIRPDVHMRRLMSSPQVWLQLGQVCALSDHDRPPSTLAPAAREDIVAGPGAESRGPLVNLVRVDLTRLTRPFAVLVGARVGLANAQEDAERAARLGSQGLVQALRANVVVGREQHEPLEAMSDIRHQRTHGGTGEPLAPIFGPRVDTPDLSDAAVLGVESRDGREPLAVEGAPPTVGADARFEFVLSLQGGELRWMTQLGQIGAVQRLPLPEIARIEGTHRALGNDRGRGVRERQ